MLFASIHLTSLVNSPATYLLILRDISLEAVTSLSSSEKLLPVKPHQALGAEIQLQGVCPYRCTQGLLPSPANHMHDNSKCTGCLPAQNVSMQSPRGRRKQFATLPKKAPHVLAQDTINLSSPAVVWPHRALESRRVFQELLQRFVSVVERTNHA